MPGRQFKETVINTLYAPQEYPYKMFMPRTKIRNVIYTQ